MLESQSSGGGEQGLVQKRLTETMDPEEQGVTRNLPWTERVAGGDPGGEWLRPWCEAADVDRVPGST